MTTKTSSVILMVLCTLLTSSAQFLWKYGSNNLKPGIFNLLTNSGIIGGFIVYGIAAVVMIIALKGGELSVLYPIIATSYIWVSLLSPMFFQTDSMNFMKWGGVFTIIAGVSLVGIGSKRMKK